MEFCKRNACKVQYRLSPDLSTPNAGFRNPQISSGPGSAGLAVANGPITSDSAISSLGTSMWYRSTVPIVGVGKPYSHKIGLFLWI
jgi:hypothetical protein